MTPHPNNILGSSMLAHCFHCLCPAKSSTPASLEAAASVLFHALPKEINFRGDSSRTARGWRLVRVSVVSRGVEGDPIFQIFMKIYPTDTIVTCRTDVSDKNKCFWSLSANYRTVDLH